MRELACKILSVAITDLRSDRPCGTQGRHRCHHCTEDARRFLLSDWAEVLFDFLDVSQERALKELGI